MEDKKKNFTINVAVVGDAGVGKSSFINRILGRKFDEYISPTYSFFYESFKFYKNRVKNFERRNKYLFNRSFNGRKNMFNL